jgi:CheY-like chemotaxis protein
MHHRATRPIGVSSGAKTILIVEDDDDIRQLLCALMERDAHRVLEASDGEEALRLVERAPPDLVLLDVNLPGIDGPEVCRQLRADAATCAVNQISTSLEIDLNRFNTVSQPPSGITDGATAGGR